MQDSGYGGTDKRPGHSQHRSEDFDCGDKENSSPNRKVCDPDIMIDRQSSQSYPALSVFTDKLHFQAAGARKALATKWTTLSTPASLPNMMFGSNASDQSMLNPETPSKSLLGTDTSNSMLFSPPSILKVDN